MPEWPGSGLQNRVRRFESGLGLDLPSTVVTPEDVGPAAAHDGGPPGSTPGPATGDGAAVGPPVRGADGRVRVCAGRRIPVVGDSEGADLLVRPAVELAQPVAASVTATVTRWVRLPSRGDTSYTSTVPGPALGSR